MLRRHASDRRVHAAAIRGHVERRPSVLRTVCRVLEDVITLVWLGFSRKVENHAAMVALYFMWYNFGRVHQTLRVTPAMEAGVSDHVASKESSH